MAMLGSHLSKGLPMIRETNLAIVGSGITGITLSKELSNLNPLLIEKARGVGGRIASRRLGETFVNHGVEEFELSHPELKNLVSKFPEYFEFTDILANPRGNINTWAKELCKGVEILREYELLKIEFTEKGHLLSFKNSDQKLISQKTILAIPGPQAQMILKNSNLETQFLSSLTYEGAVQFFLYTSEQTLLSKLESDKYFLKKIKRVSRHLLFHFEIKKDFIQHFLNLEKDEITNYFLEELNLSPSDQLETHSHKWRYSRAKSVINPDYQVQFKNRGLYLAGDYFYGNDLNSCMKSVEFIISHFN
jgi:predicted NAD/FAD-dependent oxidoreductase